MPIRVSLGDLVIDPRRLLSATRGGSAGVARDMVRRATNVQGEARKLAGRKTGKLAASIVKRGPEVVGDSIVVYVVTSLDYAKYVHDGTPAHIIRPRSRRVLRFASGGRTVFARIVHHPGTSGKKFLTRALPAARN